MRPNKEPCDLFIIGGGINGAGIAADAAGRGLSVILCEQGDLACATSSESTKLIHGGLRYLEYYEFRLVREALNEREILQKKAPHLIHSMPFIMPHNKKLKPAWMLRIGLFLYDHLGKHQKLAKSHAINLQQHPVGQIIKNDFKLGFSYSDCQVDDARLVILNALAAKQLGATILTHTRFISAQRYENHWKIDLENDFSHEKFSVLTKVLINAAGPWVEQIINQNLKFTVKNHIALVKGSHIVIPKLYPDHFAFTLVNSDNRIVFVIPYLDKYSLIGTTDIPFQGDPLAAKISPEEINYLCTAVNTYFKKSISATDIIWTYAGVRALHSGNEANPSAISRDYVLELNTDQQQAPLLSIFGGKITTYRKLAEHALADLKPFFPHIKPAWTENSPLPGGDIPDADFATFCQTLEQQYHWLPLQLINRYAANYGTLTHHFLQGIHNITELGKHFGAGLYELEIAYLIKYEWATSAEDVLWRRTKLGLLFSAEEVQILEQRMVESNNT